MKPPVLYVFSGLPGVGKTQLSRQLARHQQLSHIRIDTLEQQLRDAGVQSVTHQGYDLAYALAADQLAIGQGAVADSCNPIAITREAWASVALHHHALLVNIEVVCSDQEAHRQRVITRSSDIAGLRLPTWQQVQQRDYAPWVEPVTRIDTAGKTVEDSFATLLRQLDL